MIKVKKKKNAFFQFPVFILSEIISVKHPHLTAVGNKKSVTANTENSINWAEFTGVGKISFFFSHITASKTKYQ